MALFQLFTHASYGRFDLTHVYIPRRFQTSLYRGIG